MCDIVGYNGKKEKTIDVLINGLINLEYRGYDSSGIAYRDSDNIEIVKAVGRISNLKEQLDLKKESMLGIGHTRWATHGEANKINCHPHKVGKISIVHNGIIENYEEIKEKLTYEFKSETDTEVACALIDSLYKKTGNINKAIEEAIKNLEGSYAFDIIVDGDDNLYAVKNNSPLIIGIGEEENFIASDVPAILEYTDKYILLDEKEYAVISSKKVVVYDEFGNEINK